MKGKLVAGIGLVLAVVLVAAMVWVVLGAFSQVGSALNGGA